MKIKYIGNNVFPYDSYEQATIQELERELRKSAVHGIDIETTDKYRDPKLRIDVYKPGLDPYLSSIIMYQFYIPRIDTAYVIDGRCTDMKWYVPILEDDKILKIGHNLKFEALFFYVHLGAWMVNVWDTMIVEKILYNGLNVSYSLKGLGQRYLNKGTVDLDLFGVVEYNIDIEKEIRKLRDFYAYQGIVKVEEELYEEAIENLSENLIDKSTRMEFIRWEGPFTEKQIEYGAEDARMPVMIYEKQLKGRQLDEEVYFPKKGIRLENATVPVLARIEARGIKVNQVAWLNLYEENLKILEHRKNVLEDYVIKHYPEFTGAMSLFSEKPMVMISWASSKQVIQLFKKGGFCPKEFSKAKGKEEYTVGAVALLATLDGNYRDKFFEGKFPEELLTKEDFILAFLLYKKAEQAVTTFGKDWLKYVHPITKRVHTKFRQYLNTSRMSSTGPNMQQIPSAKPFRDCFIAEKGNYITATDFNSQESRVLAAISKVEALVSFFRDGHPIFKDDLHSFAATNMYRVITGDENLVITKNSDKKKRNIAKSLNFALAYGATAYSLMHTLSCSFEDAEKFIQAFFDGFPGLQKDFDIAQKDAIRRGWVRLDEVTDRRYFYPYFDKMRDLKARAEALRPPNWKSLTKEQKEETKKVLRETTDWSNLWGEVMRLERPLARKGLNYRIQGLSAGMTKLALILLDKLKVYIILPVHDEILTECLIEHAEAEANLVASKMQEAGTYFVQNVPMLSTPEFGEAWIH